MRPSVTLDHAVAGTLGATVDSQNSHAYLCGPDFLLPAKPLELFLIDVEVRMDLLHIIMDFGHVRTLGSVSKTVSI